MSSWLAQSCVGRFGTCLWQRTLSILHHSTVTTYHSRMKDKIGRGSVYPADSRRTKLLLLLRSPQIPPPLSSSLCWPVRIAVRTQPILTNRHDFDKTENVSVIHFR